MDNDVLLRVIRWIGVCIIFWAMSFCVVKTEPKRVIVEVKGQCETLILDKANLNK